MPSVADLQQQIAMAVLSDSEITKTRVGFYNPPKRIRKFAISDAAWDQITQMWHGHRKAGAASPPVIPLKYFVNGFGQIPLILGLTSRSFLALTAGNCLMTSETPNNSFKPNLLRYTKAMAEKACHGFGSTTQVGLTQALGLKGTITYVGNKKIGRAHV